MLMQVEAPNGFTESEFLDILITCRRHPCVILYCCGNEVQIDDTMEEKLKRMSEHCHRLAPDCLYNPMSALFNIELRMDEKESGYTKNPVPHNAVRLARVEAFSDALSPVSYTHLDVYKRQKKYRRIGGTIEIRDMAIT